MTCTCVRGPQSVVPSPSCPIHGYRPAAVPEPDVWVDGATMDAIRAVAGLPAAPPSEEPALPPFTPALTRALDVLGRLIAAHDHGAQTAWKTTLAEARALLSVPLAAPAAPAPGTPARTAFDAALHEAWVDGWNHVPEWQPSAPLTAARAAVEAAHREEVERLEGEIKRSDRATLDAMRERDEARAEVERLRAKAEQFESDWVAAKHDFGTAMAASRAREEALAAARAAVDAYRDDIRAGGWSAELLAAMDDLRAALSGLETDAKEGT